MLAAAVRPEFRVDVLVPAVGSSPHSREHHTRLMTKVPNSGQRFRIHTRRSLTSPRGSSGVHRSLGMPMARRLTVAIGRQNLRRRVLRNRAPWRLRCCLY